MPHATTTTSAATRNGHGAHRWNRRPPGWRTRDGLVLGEPEARITETYDALTRVECGGYSALMLRTAGTVTAFYVYEGRLWGFGLTRPDALLCR